MLSKNDNEILYERFLRKFELSNDDENLVLQNAMTKTLHKDKLIYFNHECHGYIILKAGSIRAYLASDNFKEITLFTIKSGENCMLCKNCFMKNFTVAINLQVEEDSEILLIPIELFKYLKEKYADVANHALALMATKFSSTMDATQQALFMPLDARIRNFLIQKSVNNKIQITHEQIALNLGSTREVISRVLKKMEKIGEISQSRGVIILNNTDM